MDARARLAVAATGLIALAAIAVVVALAWTGAWAPMGDWRTWSDTAADAGHSADTDPGRPPPVMFEDTPAPPGRRAITLAGWTFDAPGAPETPPETPKENAGRTWRTSFGAERVARAGSDTKAGFSADVVAITGLTDFKALRRQFPARDHFVMASPQAMTAALNSGRSPDAPPRPATAIVLRRAAGLRAGRRVQIFARARLRNPDLAALSSDLETATTSVPLPFAVMLSRGRTRFWLVAANFGAACAAHQDICDQVRMELTRWARAQLDRGTRVVMVASGRSDAPFEAQHRVGAGAWGLSRDSGCEVPDLSLTVFDPRAATQNPTLTAFDALLRARRGIVQTHESAVSDAQTCVLMMRAHMSAGRRPQRARTPTADLTRDATAVGDVATTQQP